MYVGVQLNYDEPSLAKVCDLEIVNTFIVKTILFISLILINYFSFIKLRTNYEPKVNLNEP